MIKGCIVINGTEVENLYLWEADFPPVYGHTSISYLKNCGGYERAKHGDLETALEVVDKCVKEKRISELKERYPEAVLLPIITNNRLPEAFARRIGMAAQSVKCRPEGYFRKDLTAMERLMLKPHFDGEIDAGGRYIIVDDIVTQGGTVSELRRFVLQNGGTVSAVTALAFSADSRIIAPEDDDVHRLIGKFSSAAINTVLREYNIVDDVWELTRSQIRYLTRFNKLESLRNRQAGITH